MQQGTTVPPIAMMPSPADAVEAQDAANAHFLGHMAAAADRFETREDIYADSGMKLLAKGAAVGYAERERLLEHKLRKPLEQSLRTADGLEPAELGRVAQALLESHPKIAAFCQTDQQPGAAQVIAGLRLSDPVRCLLTLHAGSDRRRVEHDVGVAMLALSFARRLFPQELSLQTTLAVAGLMHDIGELYIDPACLRRESRLSPEQWRQVVAHPHIGHRVLRHLEGAGKHVAEAVQMHHERLNGFGYPGRLAGEQFPLRGQILAAAESLMGIIDSGQGLGARAKVAARLLPGEFSPPILELINGCLMSDAELRASADASPALEHLVPRIERISATVGRFVQTLPWIDGVIAASQGELRQVLTTGYTRMARIRAALSSTGLDAGSPELLLSELAALSDCTVRNEVGAIVGELEWRLRDLERETRMRAALLPAADAACVVELLARLKP